MGQVSFYQYETEADKKLSAELLTLFNEDQNNTILTKAAAKFFDGRKPLFLNSYGMDTARMSLFLPELSQDQQEEPFNLCSAIFNVLAKAKELQEAKDPDMLLDDADIKGLELVAKRIKTVCDKHQGQGAAGSILSHIQLSLESSGLNFGRTK